MQISLKMTMLQPRRYLKTSNAIFSVLAVTDIKTSNSHNFGITQDI